MDARIAAQLSGVGHSMPARGSEQPDPRAPGTAKRAGGDGAAPVPALLFDANGDGAIEHWSYAHGGDSYKTFKPPPSGAVGANLKRVSHAPPRAPAVHTGRPANAHSSTTAAIHHAHEAYQRDGGAPPPDARAAASATVAPGVDAPNTPVNAAAAPVTRHPPLPSIRS